MEYYFMDTSALVKRYHLEDGSKKVDQIIDLPEKLIFITELSTVEIHSALAKKVREGYITEDQFVTAMESFYTECTQRIFFIRKTEAESFDRAINLLKKHAKKGNLRTLDAIQLASALIIFKIYNPLTFVGADEGLGGFVRKEKLLFFNPTKDASKESRLA